ncbi:DUF6497 family protein [Brevirhabdus sp.]|uniref:DUF6497 family protein n=1 Tax=Brevirhabdus sp. TaxID=2004514 RepID=UPI0040581B19
MTRFLLVRNIPAGGSRRAVARAARAGGAVLAVCLSSLAALAAAAPAQADDAAQPVRAVLPTPGGLSSLARIAVPSGQPVELLEAVVEEHEQEAWLILRYLAPQIVRDGGGGNGFDHEASAPDLDYLCNSEGVREFDARARQGAQIHQVVVTMLNRPLERGTSDPDVIQFNEAYRVEDGACMMEFY